MGLIAVEMIAFHKYCLRMFFHLLLRDTAEYCWININVMLG